MKKTKYQTVQDVLDVIDSLPACGDSDIIIRLLDGPDPHISTTIWSCSASEFKRIAPKAVSKLKIKAVKLVWVSYSSDIEYAVSIDMKQYGLSVDDLKKAFIASKHILETTENINVQTAKLSRIDAWARKVADEIHITPDDVLAVRDRFIELQHKECGLEEYCATYTEVTGRIKADEKRLAEDKKYVRSIEKTINDMNKIKELKLNGKRKDECCC